MKPELKKLTTAMVYPTLFILLLTIIWFVDTYFELGLGRYGMRPFTAEGLIGIITEPLLHSDFEHLLSNIVPLFVLGTGLFFFYRYDAVKISIFCYLLTGIWTWFMGKGTGIHIGASGLVDSLITFHLLSAIIRQRRDLEAYSLIIILLYGGFIWGFFPDFFPGRAISWQSHLSGAMAGVVAAVYFRDRGPQKIEWDWGEDDDDDNDNDDNGNDSANKVENGEENVMGNVGSSSGDEN